MIYGLHFAGVAALFVGLFAGGILNVQRVIQAKSRAFYACVVLPLKPLRVISAALLLPGASTRNWKRLNFLCVASDVDWLVCRLA